MTTPPLGYGNLNLFYKPRYSPGTSVVLEVQKAACIDTHYRLISGNDINAEWIQMQVNHVQTEAQFYLRSSLLYQSEAVIHTNNYTPINYHLSVLC